MLSKAYNPKGTEDAMYTKWQEAESFKPSGNTDAEPFSMVLPPPNATGQLHLGHAVMIALQDIFTRFARMQGKDAVWIPGTDHAAIATENVVINKLRNERNIADPRKELGREAVLEEIKEFVAGSQDTIRSQVKKMGASCDWDREAYTMDPVRSRIVNEVFKAMFEDGLIYRGHRIVNWDPHLQTNVSDDEVDHKDVQDPFYWFQYGPFVIGTVRPETKFGDKYVVVHPDDERYKEYQHGQQFECEWINGKVTATVIKDAAVDPEFGTGAMTITPWHDHTDFEIAERHNLDKQQVIDFTGNLLPVAGDFAGLPIKEARNKVIERLEEKGLVVKVDEHYTHAVSTNSRGGGTIEPQIKEQWFIDVNKPVSSWRGKWQGQTLSIKQVMQQAVRRDGEAGDKIDIIPDRFAKTYFHWIDNLRDWCISRQIWWGHRIPVWYKDGQLSTDPAKANDPTWEQDSDTLDTWFSSALWTWSTLLNEDAALNEELSLQEILAQSPDFKRYHPTTVLETGYDILPFWVARMILMTTYVTGDIPFNTVYLHGLIRTKDGAKMSKSKPETMIDPLDIIPTYGADALRLSMIVGQSPGNDSRLYEEKIAGYRNFINKLWNASRYVLLKCEEASFDPHADLNAVEPISLADKALLHHLEVLTADVTNGLETYRLSETGERLYSFTWDFFCDWYLELSKGELQPEILVYALRRILLLLHPYCPFVTEEIWQHCKPTAANLLIAESWPIAINSTFSQEAEDLQYVIDVISSIRSIRSEQAIEPHKPLSVTLYSSQIALLTKESAHIQRLAKLASVTVAKSGPVLQNVASQFLTDTEVHVSLEGVIDIEAEKKKLQAEQSKLTGFIKGLEAKLSNNQFTDNAPKAVVAYEQEKLDSNREKLAKITERLASL